MDTYGSGVARSAGRYGWNLPHFLVLSLTRPNIWRYINLSTEVSVGPFGIAVTYGTVQKAMYSMYSSELSWRFRLYSPSFEELLDTLGPRLSSGQLQREYSVVAMLLWRIYFVVQGPQVKTAMVKLIKASRSFKNALSHRTGDAVGYTQQMWLVDLCALEIGISEGTNLYVQKYADVITLHYTISRTSRRRHVLP